MSNEAKWRIEYSKYSTYCNIIDADGYVGTIQGREKAELIARVPALLSEVEKWKAEVTRMHSVAERITENYKGCCRLNAKQSAELEQLRSERDKMREALEASKIALEILEQVHDAFLPHTIVKFKKAKKLYESALSGGSKQ